MIGHRSGLDVPNSDNYDLNTPDDVQSWILSDAVCSAAREMHNSSHLNRKLKALELTVAEAAVEALEQRTVGRAAIDEVNASAYKRHITEISETQD